MGGDRSRFHHKIRAADRSYLRRPYGKQSVCDPELNDKQLGMMPATDSLQQSGQRSTPGRQLTAQSDENFRGR